MNAEKNEEEEGHELTRMGTNLNCTGGNGGGQGLNLEGEAVENGWVLEAAVNTVLKQRGYTTRYSPEQIVPLVIPPVITSISLSNTNLILNGINGQSGTTYYTLMSTNLALPWNQWTRVATNFLSTGGAFTITATNAVVPNAAQAFHILQAQ